MNYHFRSIPISFNSRVTWVNKATTVACDTSIWSTILVLFLVFHSSGPSWNFPYKQTTKFIPVTESARKPLTVFSLYFLVLLFDRWILGESQECWKRGTWRTDSLPFPPSQAYCTLSSLSFLFRLRWKIERLWTVYGYQAHMQRPLKSNAQLILSYDNHCKLFTYTSNLTLSLY